MDATTQTLARYEARYIGIEVTVAPSLLPELAALRRDALEELSFETGGAPR